MNDYKKIKRVLLVCTGNTARSPAAEYLARFYAKQCSLNDVEFDSAGFFNAFSYMQPESREFLSSKGISHSNFRPKVLSQRLLEKQDLIITMEQQHAAQIKDAYDNIPGILERVFTIKEFNGGTGDIIDPYYTNRRTYMKVMRELEAQVKLMVKRIIKLNGG